MQTRSQAKKIKSYVDDQGVAVVISPSKTGMGVHTRWTHPDDASTCVPILNIDSEDRVPSPFLSSEGSSDSSFDSLFDGPLTPLSTDHSFAMDTGLEHQVQQHSVAPVPKAPLAEKLLPPLMRGGGQVWRFDETDNAVYEVEPPVVYPRTDDEALCMYMADLCEERALKMYSIAESERSGEVQKPVPEKSGSTIGPCGTVVLDWSFRPEPAPIPVFPEAWKTRSSSKLRRFPTEEII